jgi:PHD/YefM family antitoxin component YafN of YafNO toxin-antitoxin module
MDLQYITDEKGHKSAVQLPLKDWERIQKDLDELQRLKNKKQFFLELNEAIEELNLISEGKSSARNAEDFIHELQN